MAERNFAVEKLAEMTDGLTGANSKRLIEDPKILFAYDKSESIAAEDSFSYFERAADTIRSINKLKYAEAEEREKMRRGDYVFKRDPKTQDIFENILRFWIRQIDITWSPLIFALNLKSQTSNPKPQPQPMNTRRPQNTR